MGTHKLPPKTGRLMPLNIVLVAGGWAASVALGSILTVPSGVFRVGLVVHVIALVASFGAVLLVDWYGFLWHVRQRGIHEMGRLEHAARPIIWGGIVGILASGTVLHPHLSSGLTWLKLVCVLLMINGVVVDLLVHELHANPADTRFHDLPCGIRAHMLIAMALSQLCWWTAIAVGFINTV
ncbi:hypothetical protein ACQCSX_04780 [Pseudarthrobacter sp. P1]|uniref:hypothetical protein n=1 Tax=Pseudarthrobacter sp. P1 TaxID=3418418 RepID=UPI003CF75EE8